MDKASNGLRLSRMAGWNQTLEDWKFLLREGTGKGFIKSSGECVASMIALPLGPDCGWISMVLTHPDWRRRGLARELMQTGISLLEDTGLHPVLDATPAGEKVYRQMGFDGNTRMARWILSLDSLDAVPVERTRGQARPVQMSDLKDLAALDEAQSGCNRSVILEYLLSNRPDLAFMIESDDSKPLGFIMGRSGDRRSQIGPLVATDSEIARQLLHKALEASRESVYVDAFDASLPELKHVTGVKWTLEREFTRMIRGNVNLPMDLRNCYLAIGPELS